MITEQNISKFTDENEEWYIPNTRGYFDGGAHQFSRIPMQEKLNNLGYLVSKGMDLPQIIMRYCDNHSEHIVDDLKPTLLYYIQQMRWSEEGHITDELFDDMTEVELAILLEDELKVRYQFSETVCSRWDESIENEMVKRANGNKEKFVEILQSADFSKEFLNINKI